jgi:UDP-N-acetylmuramoylalanine--D-glutamate ligase
MCETFIANFDDPEVNSGLGHIHKPAITYTLNTPSQGQIGLVENLIVDRAFAKGDAEVIFELTDVRPAIPHNVSNAMAASGLALSVGARPESISSALRSFNLDHHRLEVVFEKDGVKWVDDSKATNPHAAKAALFSQEKAIWIAGGLAKGADMEELVKSTSNRIKSAILIGTDAPIIAAALSEYAPQIPVKILNLGKTGIELMREVVRLANAQAITGDTVLLAPACASMDQFKDYADRGECFAKAIKEALHV